MKIDRVYGVEVIQDTKKILVAQCKYTRKWRLAGCDVPDGMDTRDVLEACYPGQMGYEIVVAEQLGPAYAFEGKVSLLHLVAPYEQTDDDGACEFSDYRRVNLAGALSLAFTDSLQFRLALDALSILEEPILTPPEFPEDIRPEGIFVSLDGHFFYEEKASYAHRRTWVRLDYPGAEPPRPPIPSDTLPQ